MKSGPAIHAAARCFALVATLVARPARAQGLAPPRPLDPNAPGAPGSIPPAEAATKGQLDEAEREDSGRGFELFWADAHVGAAYVDLGALSSDALALEKTSGLGPSFSVGAGARFVLFVAGARARYAPLSAFNLWQLEAEAGLKLPVRSFDVLAAVHGGYAFIGRLSEASIAPASNVSADAVKPRGVSAGVTAAVDYYVAPTFSVGLGLTADALFLHRPRGEAPPSAATAADPLVTGSGSGVGLQVGALLRAGLHLGL